MKPVTVTLAAIRAHDPCQPAFDEFVTAMNGWPENKPFPVARIVRLSKVEHAYWSLNAVKPTKANKRRMRHLAADLAESCLATYESYAPGDSRVRDCIATARRFADGRATEAERAAAGAAAWAAAWAARAAGAAWAARAAGAAGSAWAAGAAWAAWAARAAGAAGSAWAAGAAWAARAARAAGAAGAAAGEMLIKRLGADEVTK